MKNVNKLALAGLQIVTAVGGLEGAAQPTQADTSRADLRHHEVNQLSLAAIEQSWLAIPRICKAAGFNAQPRLPQSTERSMATHYLYTEFLV